MQPLLLVCLIFSLPHFSARVHTHPEKSCTPEWPMLLHLLKLAVGKHHCASESISGSLVPRTGRGKSSLWSSSAAVFLSPPMDAEIMDRLLQQKEPWTPACNATVLGPSFCFSKEIFQDAISYWKLFLSSLLDKEGSVWPWGNSPLVVVASGANWPQKKQRQSNTEFKNFSLCL